MLWDPSTHANVCSLHWFEDIHFNSGTSRHSEVEKCNKKANSVSDFPPTRTRIENLNVGLLKDIVFSISRHRWQHNVFRFLYLRIGGNTRKFVNWFNQTDFTNVFDFSLTNWYRLGRFGGRSERWRDLIVLKKIYFLFVRQILFCKPFVHQNCLNLAIMYKWVPVKWIIDIKTSLFEDTCSSLLTYFQDSMLIAISK